LPKALLGAHYRGGEVRTRLPKCRHDVSLPIPLFDLSDTLL
jgi:hypothetical protein